MCLALQPCACPALTFALTTSPPMSLVTRQLVTRPASSTPPLVFDPTSVALAPPAMSVASLAPGKALAAGTTEEMTW